MSCNHKYPHQQHFSSTYSSTSGRGDFPIQGPLGPHQSPKTARHTPQNDPFSLLCFQTSDVKQPQIPTPAIFVFQHTYSSTSGMGYFPIQEPLGPHQSLITARHTLLNHPFSLSCFQTVKVISCNYKYLHQPNFWVAVLIGDNVL